MGQEQQLPKEDKAKELQRRHGTLVSSGNGTVRIEREASFGNGAEPVFLVTAARIRSAHA
jgi:hypothetical protein